MHRTCWLLSFMFITLKVLFSQPMQKREADQPNPPFLEKAISQSITKPLSLRYLVHLPAGYDSTTELWPLLLYLHGGMGRGDDFQKLYWYPIPKMMLEHEFPNTLIAVIPQCPDNKMWPELTDELTALIRTITRQYRIDTTRVYGLGYSMGGNGIVYLAYTQPEIFTAIAAMSGYYDKWWVSRIKAIPIWFFHGAQDTLVSVAEADDMVTTYQKSGKDVKYTRDPTGAHRPPTVEQHLEVFQWFLKQSK